MECNDGVVLGKVVDQHEEPIASAYEAEDFLENAKPFFVRNEWVDSLGPWCGSGSRVNRGITPWTGVGEIVDPQRFKESIRYHIWV